MTQLNSAHTSGQPEVGPVLAFYAANVTGTQDIPIEIGARTRVAAVTDSLAHRMALPDDVAWALRDDDTSAFLDDTRPIGDQIAPGAHVTVIPKAHLGGTARA